MSQQAGPSASSRRGQAGAGHVPARDGVIGIPREAAAVVGPWLARAVTWQLAPAQGSESTETRHADLEEGAAMPHRLTAIAPHAARPTSVTIVSGPALGCM